MQLMLLHAILSGCFAHLLLLPQINCIRTLQRRMGPRELERLGQIRISDKYSLDGPPSSSDEEGSRHHVEYERYSPEYTHHLGEYPHYPTSYHYQSEKYPDHPGEDRHYPGQYPHRDSHNFPGQYGNEQAPITRQEIESSKKTAESSKGKSKLSRIKAKAKAKIKHVFGHSSTSKDTRNTRKSSTDVYIIPEGQHEGSISSHSGSGRSSPERSGSSPGTESAQCSIPTPDLSVMGDYVKEKAMDIAEDFEHGAEVTVKAIGYAGQASWEAIKWFGSVAGELARSDD